MTDEKNRSYTSGPVVAGPALEYAMLVVEPSPARTEKPGDIILLGSGNTGRMRQELGLRAWHGWVPLERVISPWVVTDRQELIDNSDVTVPRRDYIQP